MNIKILAVNSMRISVLGVLNFIQQGVQTSPAPHKTFLIGGTSARKSRKVETRIKIKYL